MDMKFQLSAKYLGYIVAPLATVSQWTKASAKYFDIVKHFKANKRTPVLMCTLINMYAMPVLMFLAQCSVPPQAVIRKIEKEMLSLTSWSYNTVHNLIYQWQGLGMINSLHHFPSAARATMIRAFMQTINTSHQVVPEIISHDIDAPLFLYDEAGIFKGKFDAPAFYTTMQKSLTIPYDFGCIEIKKMLLEL